MRKTVWQTDSFTKNGTEKERKFPVALRMRVWQYDPARTLQDREGACAKLRLCQKREKHERSERDADWSSAGCQASGRKERVLLLVGVCVRLWQHDQGGNQRSDEKNPVQSCGCVRQEKDIEGQRFGRLTALYPTAKRLGGSIVWMCRCDCGNVTEVSYNDLRSGNTKSCGCMVHEKGGLPLAYVDDTCVESLKSKTLYKNNTSGCTGVLWQKGRWVAQISFRKCRYYLGSYERLEDAVFVRRQAERLLHDSFVEQYEKWEQNDEGWKREYPLKIVVKGTNIDDFELEVVEQYRGNDEEKGKGKSDRYAVFGTAGERKRPGQT